ncbi:MAG: transposase [Bdellovibrio sp.]
MQIELTDEQWKHINKYIPERKRSKGGKGRPSSNNRLIMNGILWIMWTGAPWAALLPCYGSRATCHPNPWNLRSKAIQNLKSNFLNFPMP